MNTQALLDPKSWAEQTLGGVQLHERRRTRRTVQAASSLAENPLGSLPAQMHTWKETKALYRLLDEPDVTFAALMHPHFEQPRQQANASAVVLLVQDTTDIDLSHRRKISGVGQIGNERGRGFFVQTVLAVRPQSREVLGCMAQEPFVRVPAPQGEQRHQRRVSGSPRNRCLDPPDPHHGDTCCRKRLGACGRSGCGYVPVLSSLSGHPDPLSGAGGEVTARAGQRRRASVFADAYPRL